MSTNINLGSGRTEISIAELVRMKASTESLIKEIKSRTSTVIAQARSVAISAYGEYSYMVSGQTSAVTSQCNALETASSGALKELEALVKGLDQVIEGYLTLENTLAASCDTEFRPKLLWGASAYTSM